VEESDDDDGEPKSELQLMYNTVRGYVSAIMKLNNHQISVRLHASPCPHNVAIKAMKTSIARGQHQRRRAEFLLTLFSGDLITFRTRGRPYKSNKRAKCCHQLTFLLADPAWRALEQRLDDWLLFDVSPFRVYAGPGRL
jgi:hypothetical protein